MRNVRFNKTVADIIEKTLCRQRCGMYGGCMSSSLGYHRGDAEDIAEDLYEKGVRPARRKKPSRAGVKQ